MQGWVFPTNSSAIEANDVIYMAAEWWSERLGALDATATSSLVEFWMSSDLYHRKGRQIAQTNHLPIKCRPSGDLQMKCRHEGKDDKAVRSKMCECRHASTGLLIQRQGDEMKNDDNSYRGLTWELGCDVKLVNIRAIRARYRESCQVKPVEMRATT